MPDSARQERRIEQRPLAVAPQLHVDPHRAGTGSAMGRATAPTPPPTPIPRHPSTRRCGSRTVARARIRWYPGRRRPSPDAGHGHVRYRQCRGFRRPARGTRCRTRHPLLRRRAGGHPRAAVRDSCDRRRGARAHRPPGRPGQSTRPRAATTSTRRRSPRDIGRTRSRPASRHRADFQAAHTTFEEAHLARSIVGHGDDRERDHSERCQHDEPHAGTTTRALGAVERVLIAPPTSERRRTRTSRGPFDEGGGGNG